MDKRFRNLRRGWPGEGHRVEGDEGVGSDGRC